MRTFLAVMGVEKPFYRLSSQNCALDDLPAVLYLHMYILVIIGLNTHQRAKFTESLTAGLKYAYMRDIFLHFHSYTFDILTELNHLLINLLGTGGNAAGAGTYKNTAGIALKFTAHFTLSF